MTNLKKTRYTIILLLVLLSLKNNSIAQNNIDSLKVLIASEKQDTNRVMLLNKLAIFYQYSNQDTCFFYAQKSLMLARKIGFLKGEGNCLTIIGNDFLLAGNYSEALQFHLKALKIREKIKDFRGMGVSYANISSIYSEQGDEKKALETILKAKTIAESINNQPLLVSSLTMLGDSYEKLNKLDSARIIAELGYNLAEKLNNDEIQGLNLSNLGNIYAKKGESLLALMYYKRSIPKSMSVNNDETLCETTLGIAKEFNKLGNRDSALLYAQKSFLMSQSGGFIKDEILVAAFLSSYFKSINIIDSAYAYQEITIALKDSVFGQEKTRELQKIIFAEQLRQQEIEENNRKEMEKRESDLQLIGIAAFLPLFFGIVLVLSKRKIKQVIVVVLGQLVFLLLFEFISLFLHPYIEMWTDHSPIYMLLTLVFIAALIGPLHHHLTNWLKERLTHKIVVPKT